MTCRVFSDPSNSGTTLNEIGDPHGSMYKKIIANVILITSVKDMSDEEDK